jgi:hypothetical protein
LGNPDLITYGEIYRILKISTNFLTWKNLIDDAAPKMVALVRTLEPVFGEVWEYETEITNICLNLAMSMESSLQYACLELVEVGYSSSGGSKLNDRKFMWLIDNVTNILEYHNPTVYQYVKDRIYELNH